MHKISPCANFHKLCPYAFLPESEGSRNKTIQLNSVHVGKDPHISEKEAITISSIHKHVNNHEWNQSNEESGGQDSPTVWRLIENV